jgi:hypothetical protein
VHYRDEPSGEVAYTGVEVEAARTEDVLEEYKRYKARGGEPIDMWERKLSEQVAAQAKGQDLVTAVESSNRSTSQ